MKQIVVVKSERRDWNRKNVPVEAERRAAPQKVTRRYVMFADEPQFRDALREKFEVLPHESGKDYLFYCMAQPSARRAKEFVKEIRYKLKKSETCPADPDSLEIVTA